MSEGTKLLVVLGATGAQGGAILRHFAREGPDYQLRGISRDPTSTKSTELTSIGVETVKADLKDEASLRRAFEGASHIFVNIDSVELIMEGMQNPDLLELGQSPFERGATQEKLLAQNVINAAAASNTLERIIWSSLPSPSVRSKGKYTLVTHCDAKAAVEEMFRANEILAPKLSLLIFGLYLDMPLRLPMLYPISKDVNGRYELSLALTGDERLPFANVESDGGDWVASLCDSAPGVKLIGCSEMLSWKEWVQRWAARNGVQAQYFQCSEEVQMALMGGAGASVLQAMQFAIQYGMAGGDANAVLPKDVGASTTSVAEAMVSVDWSSIL